MIDRLNAALTDRYRVKRKLGEGGMATARVYAVPMEVSPDGALRPGPPELLFDQPFHRNSVGDQSYDVAPDGSLIMIDGVRAAEVAVLVNRLSELPRRTS